GRERLRERPCQLCATRSPAAALLVSSGNGSYRQLGWKPQQASASGHLVAPSSKALIRVVETGSPPASSPMDRERSRSPRRLASNRRRNRPSAPGDSREKGRARARRPGGSRFSRPEEPTWCHSNAGGLVAPLRN